MEKNIYKALINLPEALVTPQIVAAAIEEGNINLLDYLPQKHLTGEVVLSIIQKNENPYSWDSFNLANLPKQIRSKEVCEFAVKKKSNNIISVPAELRSTTMLNELLKSTESNLQYLHLFPQTAWNEESLLKGVRSVYTNTTYNYQSRGRHQSAQTYTDIKKVQIFLTFVPPRLKTKTFYHSLFTTQFTTEDTNLITPEKFKKKAYYIQVAQKEFKLVPPAFYDYDLFIVAIDKRQITYRHTNDAALQEAICNIMDEAMADKIIEIEPYAFDTLPKKFQTTTRLITAIEKDNNNNLKIGDSLKYLLSEDVCKTYVRKNSETPVFPESVWTPAFVNYCMKHGTSYRWFKQMPKHFQTREMVGKVLDYSSYHITDVLPELISLEQAQEIYRTDKYRREHIPPRFIREFVEETGLNEEFFGGEVTLSIFKESKNDYTYCKLGHNYIGIHKESDYRYTAYILTMTRRTPQAFRPQPVFERKISTFHTTWLERMIADYDQTFTKPCVPKAQKEFQTNSYYTVAKIQDYKGVTIHTNSLLGETVNYTAKLEGNISHFDTLNQLKGKIDDSQQTNQEPTLTPQPADYPNLQPVAS